MFPKENASFYSKVSFRFFFFLYFRIKWLEYKVTANNYKHLCIFQSAFSHLYFTDVLWPDFTAWHLLAAVFHYQRTYTQLAEIRSQLPTPCLSNKAQQFLTVVEENYWKNAALTLSA